MHDALRKDSGCTVASEPIRHHFPRRAALTTPRQTTPGTENTEFPAIRTGRHANMFRKRRLGGKPIGGHHKIAPEFYSSRSVAYHNFSIDLANKSPRSQSPIFLAQYENFKIRQSAKVVRVMVVSLSRANSSKDYYGQCNGQGAPPALCVSLLNRRTRQACNESLKPTPPFGRRFQLHCSAVQASSATIPREIFQDDSGESNAQGLGGGIPA